MKGLADKVAIVTGGATSIGAAIADAFRNAGAKIAIADIDGGAGMTLASRLGDGALFRRTDVTDDAQIASCAEAVVAQFGGIDFLVNCAVTMHDKGLSSSREEWLAALNVNIVGAARFASEAAPHMIRRGGGAIVNFSSIAGKFGQSGRALYPVAKAAILQLTRNQAMELAPHRIRVNAVAPGWTWSTVIERLAKGDRAKADRVAGQYHPLGRVGDAADVADAVLFLCSDHARFITGIDLPVDGGYHMTGPDRGRPAMAQLGE
jgi:NAD(P)-dependent dehydrogenase (short-subunit alcohol dehydrogenase family)